MSFYPPSPSLESIARSALTTSDGDFNLDPVAFDSIVHTERPTMPESVEDVRDRVHIHTSHEDWIRFQPGEQQRYILDSAPEATDVDTRHARFFIPAGNIYFSIEDTLYGVPRAPFERHSSTAFTGKGLTEDDPLILEDVRAAHFDHLLSILHPSEYGSGVYTAVTVDDWTAILHLAVRWGFHSIKTLAIKQLTPIATDIDKIVLGRQYDINPWLHEAFTAVCMREQSVTKEEGRRMRVDDIIEINAIRQLYRPAAQPTQVSTLSIGEACAGFDLLQFVSLPEPAMPAVSEEVDSTEKSREAAALLLGQLKHLRTSCLSQFKKEMLDGLKGNDYRFVDVVASARERCEARFKTGAQVAVVKGTDWTRDDEMNLLSKEIVVVGDQCRKDETKKMLDLTERNFTQQISEPVYSALNKGDPRMWGLVLASFKETVEKAEDIYLTKAKSYNCTKEENSSGIATLRKRAWLALRAKIDEKTTNDFILSKLRGHFEKRFRYNEHGALRVWKSQDAIDGAFKRARDQVSVPIAVVGMTADRAPQTLELVQLYSKFTGENLYKWHAHILPPDAEALSSPDEVFDFDATLTILTEEKKLHLAAKFRRDAHAYYFDAQRSTVHVAIPLWMYGVLVNLARSRHRIAEDISFMEIPPLRPMLYTKF
ncbi:RHD3-domain-containing protein [Athelia psychrophila]|uniref:RHD3-domain-containing protein n=1 Tax=Athelia psychrophila TaxID=1759441 RepID=A0A166FC75_9AGAM|nr:RHD3-domain-containing protein [Fibularhizoctonia sp. CBS 109695]